MFAAHLIFADIDGSSSYSFAKRVYVIRKFQEICWDKKPEPLSSHSFFSVDNDSLMIGFGGKRVLIAMRVFWILYQCLAKSFREKR